MPEIEELIKQPIEKVMIRSVVCMRIDQSLESMVAVLRDKGISGVPVVDRTGKVCGVATEYDLVRFISGRAGMRIRLPIELFALDRNERLDALRLLEELKSARVSDIMTSPAITVPPSMQVRDVIALMVKNEINRIPIVENGRPVGIVTRADIMFALSAG